MPFRPNDQLALLENSFNPIAALRQSLTKQVPWSSIIEFATSTEYCGQSLYPRQQTLLRLIYLETENMTDYDREVIDGWRMGFEDRIVCGVQPDIWHRVEYLKRRGYRRFPHIQAVLGRRASKGFIGAILGAEQIAYLIAMDNPQANFNIREGKSVFLNVGATSQTQAQRQLFADIREVVQDCAWLQPYIAEMKEHQMRLRTPADVRRLARLRSQGQNVETLIASLWGVPLSASSVVGRGATSYCNMFDEFAFHVQGTGSVKSGDEIYEDWQPSLGQFKKDALTYVPSSPFCLAPETRVLTQDLRWVPVGSLTVGQRLVGFDEHLPGGKGKGRCWRPAVVTETSVIHAPRYKITMESGKELVSTSEHMWLARRSQYDYEWFKTSKLKPGDKIKSLGVEPWGVDDSREAGYLAGFFDGEGYLSGRLNKFQSIGYCQNNGPTNAYVKDLLIKKGFSFTDYTPCQKLAKIRLNGGMGENMRFLGQIRPERLLPKFHEVFYGSRIYGSATKGIDIVESVEYLDEGEVIALGTSTNTLVAEGLLSHNTKTGKFYELYNQGRVLMASYEESAGVSTEARAEIAAARMRADLDEVELKADPTMLIIQGPSWMLYEDFERGAELTGFQADFAPENDLRDEEQQRRRRKNPEKFAVERLGQFAEVLGQYLDSGKVEAMFRPVEWRDPALCPRCDEDGLVRTGRYAGQPCLHPLAPSPFGRFDHIYRMHVDPSSVDANFALAIGHTEPAPPDQTGQVWPHVIIDRLHVWQASDFPENPETGKCEIDQTQVEREISELLYTFPSTSIFSSDQWNSVGFLQRLRKKYSPDIRVIEVTATEKVNWERAEKFKSALNLGWVHCLAGETRVLTAEGVCPIRELAGGTHRILTTQNADGRGGGVWVDAPISSFGVSPLMKVVLRRNGVEKIIHATEQHRWFVRRQAGTASWRDEVLTKNLKAGQKLSYCYAQRHMGTRPSPIGIAHGFTYGDGTRSRKGSVAQFCGDKDKPLVPYFDLHPIVDVRPGVRRALDLPRFFKEQVDLQESPSYLYGWLAGYMAADGHVTKEGQVEIDSNDRGSLEHVRMVCNLLGIHTTSIRTKPTYGHGYIDNDGYAVNLDTPSLTEEFFLIEEHRQRWLDNRDKRRKDYRGYTVVSVEHTDRIEEVFCAEVPVTHSFVLEDNILTGNSYRDNFFDGESLLENECKFLSEKNGKVYKQEFGPVQTKDLYDAVSTVVVDLLSEALERWDAGTMTASAHGSTNVAGLRSGREFERAAVMGNGSVYQQGTAAGIYRNGVRQQADSTKAWERLDEHLPTQRRRSQYFPDRTRAATATTNGRERRQRRY